MPEDMKLTPRQETLLTALDLADPDWRKKAREGETLDNFFAKIVGDDLTAVRSELASMGVSIERVTQPGGDGMRLVGNGQKGKKALADLAALELPLAPQAQPEPQPEPSTLTPRQQTMIATLDLADPDWRKKAKNGEVLDNYFAKITGDDLTPVRSELASMGVTVERVTQPGGDGMRLVGNGQKGKKALADLVDMGVAPAANIAAPVATPALDTPAPVAAPVVQPLTAGETLLLDALDATDPDWRLKATKPVVIHGFLNNEPEVIAAARFELGRKHISHHLDPETMGLYFPDEAGVAKLTELGQRRPAPVVQNPLPQPTVSSAALTEESLPIYTMDAPSVDAAQPRMSREQAENIITADLRRNNPDFQSGSMRVAGYFRDMEPAQRAESVAALNVVLGDDFNSFRVQRDNLDILERERFNAFQQLGQRQVNALDGSVESMAFSASPSQASQNSDYRPGIDENANALLSESSFELDVIEPAPKKQKMTRDEARELVAARLVELGDDWRRGDNIQRQDIKDFFANMDTARAAQLETAVGLTIGKGNFKRLAGGKGDATFLAVTSEEAVRTMLSLNDRPPVLRSTASEFTDLRVEDLSPVRVDLSAPRKQGDALTAEDSGINLRNVDDSGISLANPLNVNSGINLRNPDDSGISLERRASEVSEVSLDELRAGNPNFNPQVLDQVFIEMGENAEAQPAKMTRDNARQIIAARLQEFTAEVMGAENAKRLEIKGFFNVDEARAAQLEEALALALGADRFSRLAGGLGGGKQQLVMGEDGSISVQKLSASPDLSVKGIDAVATIQELYNTPNFRRPDDRGISLEALDRLFIERGYQPKEDAPTVMVIGGDPIPPSFGKPMSREDAEKYLLAFKDITTFERKGAGRDAVVEIDTTDRRNMLAQALYAIGATPYANENVDKIVVKRADIAKLEAVIGRTETAAEREAREDILEVLSAGDPIPDNRGKRMSEDDARQYLANYLDSNDYNRKGVGENAVVTISGEYNYNNELPKALYALGVTPRFGMDRMMRDVVVEGRDVEKLEAALGYDLLEVVEPDAEVKGPSKQQIKNGKEMRAVSGNAIFKEGEGENTVIIINYLEPSVQPSLEKALRSSGMKYEGGRRDMDAAIVIRGQDAVRFEAIRETVIDRSPDGTAQAAIKASAEDIVRGLSADDMKPILGVAKDSVIVNITRLDEMDGKTSRALKALGVNFNDNVPGLLAVSDKDSIQKLESYTAPIVTVDKEQADATLKGLLNAKTDLTLAAPSGTKNVGLKDILKDKDDAQVIDVLRALEAKEIKFIRVDDTLFVADKDLRELAKLDDRIKPDTIEPGIKASEAARFSKVIPLGKEEAEQIVLRTLVRGKQSWADDIAEGAVSAMVYKFFEGLREPAGVNRAESALQALNIDYERKGDALFVFGDGSVDRLRDLNKVELKPEVIETPIEIPNVAKSESKVIAIKNAIVRGREDNEPFDRFAARGETAINAETHKHQVKVGDKTYELKRSEDPALRAQGVREIVGDDKPKVGNIEAKYADEQGFLLNADGKRIKKDLPVGIKQGVDYATAATSSSMIGFTELFQDRKTGESKSGVAEMSTAVTAAFVAIKAGPAALGMMSSAGAVGAIGSAASATASVASAVVASGVLPWMLPVALVVGYGMYQKGTQAKENGEKGFGIPDINMNKAITMGTLAVATVMTAGVPALALTTAIAGVIAGNQMSWSNKVSKGQDQTVATPNKDQADRPKSTADKILARREEAAKNASLKGQGA